MRARGKGPYRSGAPKVTSTIRNKYLTVAELSEYLQIHRTTIYRMLRQGKLPGFRIGSDWRFSLEAIEQWQRDQTKIDVGNQMS
jgi:excisionase family DNA binding protein